MEMQNACAIANPYQFRPDGAEMDISNCRVHRGIAGIAECMVANILCPCKLSYGYSRFCRHPLVEQIAESVMP